MAVRPNFVVGEHYCMCFILETTPPEGIALHGKGSFRAHVVCSEELFRSLPKAASFNYVRPSACSQRETSEIISVNEAAAMHQ